MTKFDGTLFNNAIQCVKLNRNSPDKECKSPPLDVKMVTLNWKKFWVQSNSSTRCFTTVHTNIFDLQSQKNRSEAFCFLCLLFRFLIIVIRTRKIIKTPKHETANGMGLAPQYNTTAPIKPPFSCLLLLYLFRLNLWSYNGIRLVYGRQKSPYMYMYGGTS